MAATARKRSTSPASSARVRKLGQRMVALKAEVVRAERQWKQAMQRADAATMALAKAACPLRKGSKVVLDARSVMTVQDIQLLGVKPGGHPTWVAHGPVMRYDPSEVKPRLVSRYASLLDKDWRKLPKSLPAPAKIAQSWANERQTWLQKAASKPLTLTQAQRGLLSHLIERDGSWPLLGTLPRGVTWSGSRAADQRSWQGLVDKGVLVRLDEKGDAAMFHEWIVGPGARLEDAGQQAGIQLNTRSIAQARKRKVSLTPMP